MCLKLKGQNKSSQVAHSKAKILLMFWEIIRFFSSHRNQMIPKCMHSRIFTNKFLVKLYNYIYTWFSDIDQSIYNKLKYFIFNCFLLPFYIFYIMISPKFGISCDGKCRFLKLVNIYWIWWSVLKFELWFCPRLWEHSPQKLTALS